MTFLRDCRKTNGPNNLKNASQSLLEALREDAMDLYFGGVKYPLAWDDALSGFTPPPSKFLLVLFDTFSSNSVITILVNPKMQEISMM
jgi:hypothetical protein